jgi:hypothetical protein
MPWARKKSYMLLTFATERRLAASVVHAGRRYKVMTGGSILPPDQTQAGADTHELMHSGVSLAHLTRVLAGRTETVFQTLQPVWYVYSQRIRITTNLTSIGKESVDADVAATASYSERFRAFLSLPSIPAE